MRMVIGGRAQGKLAYLLRNTGMGFFQVCDGGTCPLDQLPEAPVVYNLHLLIRRLMEVGRDPADFITQLVEQNPDLCIVTDEVGCGVVPVDPFQRQWRETTGRICCRLAQQAQRVDRVYAGVPVTIKLERVEP